MTGLFVPLALAVVLAGLALWARARERRTCHAVAAEVAVARERGSDRARLQYPHIDLSRCLGCGLCVTACPEEGVLEVLLGQARVVHGARCVGHGRCAEACPVDAIALTLGDVGERTDLPALADDLEAVGSPGVFLAGEVTGFALVRTAVTQGASVGREVARRAATLNGSRTKDAHDLVIVGAGPAGLACALSAREAGLDFVVLEQASRVGGTVASYPRQKLVMTQPMQLPLFGTLKEATYSKEVLVELWEKLTADHALPMKLDGKLESIKRVAAAHGDVFEVHTSLGVLRTRNVCLALGRRGSPRKLGVPGEDLPKVSYSLLDARSYAGRHVLVVGGGDSAVEAALGLAAQPGTTVTISYRKGTFFRLKAANEARVHAALVDGKLSAAFGTEVEAIESDRVLIKEANGSTLSLRNDDVFVFAGGEAPFELLARCGVSFDPKLRAPVELPGERGTGIVPALFGAAAIAALVAAWGYLHRDYYALDAAHRLLHPDHGWLRSARSVGLGLGIGSALAISVNLLYLVRRNLRIEWGSLRIWMTVHVATGVTALLLALVHGGFQPRVTTGGRALAALGVLVVTGAIGRYLYAFVPRAASGRELALEEVQSRLAALDREWEGDHPEFRDRVRARVAELVAATHFSRGLLARLSGVLSSGFALRRALRELRAVGASEGVPAGRVDALLVLARRSHRAALAATWLEELRALMATWRYLHRWVALLMVILVVVHVFMALRYGRVGLGAAQ
jgi:thioredoxin reductase/Pyruvate/2-oxoacid:ferredoxin oxidoreductase delta subunit